MSLLKTSKGYLEYDSRLLYFGNKVLEPGPMFENLKILALYLDKIDINWGPAFGTLIGIIRNDDFQPWKPIFDIYILKEDEERFKDILWLLMDAGFRLVRYERRGRYYIERNGEYIKVFVLTKVCSDVRHTGSSDFIHEKYIQNTVKWNFKGIVLNVPQEVDEYLSFQYGDWTVPKQTVVYSRNIIKNTTIGQVHGCKTICLITFTINGYYIAGRRILQGLRQDVKRQECPFLRMFSLQACSLASIGEC